MPRFTPLTYAAVLAIIAAFLFSPAGFGCYDIPQQIKVTGTTFDIPKQRFAVNSRGFYSGDDLISFDADKKQFCVKARDPEAKDVCFEEGTSLTDDRNDNVIGWMSFNNITREITVVQAQRPFKKQSVKIVQPALDRNAKKLIISFPVYEGLEQAEVHWKNDNTGNSSAKLTSFRKKGQAGAVLKLFAPPEVDETSLDLTETGPDYENGCDGLKKKSASGGGGSPSSATRDSNR